MSPPQEQDPGIARLDPMPGRVIGGNFRIDKLIGAGAMGNVYKALQVSLNKPVAVKILHHHLHRDERLVARFKREAKSASLLNHPNSIQIIDSGEDSDGTLYIAMELLDRARPGAGDPRRLSAAAAAHRPHHVAGPERARRGARAGGHSPRPQAEQHHADRAPGREGLRQGVRLRHRQGDARRRRGRPLGDAHRAGPGVRHARVHVPRTGARRTAGRARGSVFGGGDPLPAGDGRHPVPRGDGDGHHQPSSRRTARAAQPPAARPQHPGRRRSDRPARAGEGPRASVRQRDRVPRRHRHDAER